MPEPHALGGIPHATLEAARAEILDVVSASVIYQCEAVPGADSASPVWRCRKMTTTGGVTRTTWADNGEYTQIADNRASLTYS